MKAEHRTEMEQLSEEHDQEMEQLSEEHDQEMVEMAEKLLAKATEAKVISYAPNGKEGELTAGPLCNSLVEQLVSIKIDQRWTAPTVQVLVGIGVIVARDEDFTIIKIIRKYPHSNEWKYITDANEEQHREQLAHTTVSTAIPYSVLRRVSK